MTIQKEFGKLSSMMHKIYHQAAAAAEQTAKLVEVNIDEDEETILNACDDFANSVQESAANLEQHLISVLERRRQSSREPQPGDQLAMEITDKPETDEGKQLTA